MSYLFRRLIRALLLLAGVSVLCFLFTDMARGTFFDELRLNPQISQETISNLEARYGLNQSWVARYGRWAKSALQADLGHSIAYNIPVTSLLSLRAKNTLLLTASAMILTWIVSIPIGICSAARRGGFLDHVVTVVSSTIISIPELVIALGFLAFAVRWRILPVGGMMSVDADGFSAAAKVRDIALHMVLPVLILGLIESAVIVRHVRASVFEVLDAPYVNAARALGIARWRILTRQVLPAAANSAITLFGLSLGGLLSGSLLVEVVCGWPGLGPLILEATLSRDLYVVIGGLMLSAIFIVGGGLLADTLLVVVDPRIRIGAAHAR